MSRRLDVNHEGPARIFSLRLPGGLVADVEAFRAEREEVGGAPVSLGDAVRVLLTEALSARVRRRRGQRVGGG